MFDQLKHPFAYEQGDPELELESTPVFPTEADDGVDYRCHDSECDQYLRARGPSADGRVRHFWHPGGGRPDGCASSIGESEIHRLCADHVAQKLFQWYDGEHIAEEPADCYEQSIGDRRADALVRFDDEHTGAPFGRGIAVEVQYRNHGKDKEATTADYRRAGYSVAWIEAEDDFETANARLRLDLDRQGLEQRTDRLWPTCVPDPRKWAPEHSDPPNVLSCNGPASAKTVQRAGGETEVIKNRAESWYELVAGQYGLPMDILEPPSYSKRVRLPEEFYDELVPDLRDVWKSAIGPTVVKVDPTGAVEENVNIPESGRELVEKALDGIAKETHTPREELPPIGIEIAEDRSKAKAQPLHGSLIDMETGWGARDRLKCVTVYESGFTVADTFTVESDGRHAY